MTIASPFIGKWIDRDGDKRANIFFMSLFIIASISLFFLGPKPNFYLLCIALLLFGLSIATAFISTITGALANVPENKMGAATGVYLTIAWIGCAIGVAFSGTAIAYEGTASLHRQLQEQRITLSPAQLDVADRAAKGIFPVSDLHEEIPSSILPKIKEITASSFVDGVHANVVIFLICCVLGLVLAFFLKARKRQKT